MEEVISLVVALLTVRLRAPFAHTLKEKRAILRSLLAKLRNKFNVSAAETGSQDIHAILEISVAAIAADTAQADSIMDTLLRFIEANTEAETLDVQRALL